MAEEEEQIEGGRLGFQRMVDMYEHKILKLEQILNQDEEIVSNNGGGKVSAKLAIYLASSESE